MRKLSIFIGIWLLPAITYSQRLDPFPDLKTKQWGYKNEKGVVVIQPRFEAATSFSEGLASVVQNTRYGFIDPTGKVVIPCKYSKTGSFHNGRAWVYNKGSAFYINKNGQKVFELTHSQLDLLYDFSEGLVKAYVYNISRKSSGPFGYYDTTGKLVIADQFNDATDFRSGIAVVARASGPYPVYGAIDKSGKEVIPFKYNSRGKPFSFDKRGLAWVELNGEHFYIDRAGQVVKPENTGGLYDEKYGVRKIEAGSFFGLADKSGKTIIPAIYDELWVDSYTGQVTVTRKGLKGIYNTKGVLVVPVKYEFIGSFHDNTAPIRSGDKWGMIHSSGKEIIPPKYDAINDAGPGITTVSLNGKKGLVDRTGKLLAQPIYDEIEDFWNNEFTIVSLSDKKGVISKAGKVIVPVKYQKIGGSLKAGPFSASEYNGHSVYDKSGKLIIPPGKYHEYQFINPMIFARKVYDKYAVLDQTGKELIPKKYADVAPLSEGYAKVDSGRKFALFGLAAKKELTGFLYDDIKAASANTFIVKSGNKYGLAGSTGELLAEIKYDEIIPIEGKLCKVKSNGKYGLMNGLGQEITPLHFSEIFTGERNLKENEIVARPMSGKPQEYYDMNGNKIEDTIKDYTISTITIGQQIWMAGNLNVEKFRNGDVILQAKTKEEWEKAGKERIPAWCYYNNEPANEIKFGKLYNWYAVNDPRGLAPVGWHIPSDTEWIQLINFLGESTAGKKMKSTSVWKSSYGDGTDESGFSALPGGFRDRIGSFKYAIEEGFWWTSTEKDTSDAISREFYYKSETVRRNSQTKANGLYIRCVKD